MEKKEYLKAEFGEMEIASMTGNLAVANGELVLHIHCVLSGRDMQAACGHLFRAITGPTCEVFLQPLPFRLKREPDDFTGLKLLEYD